MASLTIAKAVWRRRVTIFIVVLTGQRFGVQTRDVPLWPFGGIASMELPEPGQTDRGACGTGETMVQPVLAR